MDGGERERDAGRQRITEALQPAPADAVSRFNRKGQKKVPSPPVPKQGTPPTSDARNMGSAVFSRDEPSFSWCTAFFFFPHTPTWSRLRKLYNSIHSGI